MAPYILLGIIQGLTEFLPVSSSAHLVIMQKVLGINSYQLELPIVLHAGTALALILFFFKDILKMIGDIRLLSLVFIVTVITGVIGITGKDFFESLFNSTTLVSFTLIITGVILIATKRFMHPGRSNLNIRDALTLGLVQGIAIIPGISRSGITISTLLFRKIDRQIAFTFSFLASIPAIFGALLLELRRVDAAFKIEYVNFTVGFISSLASGLIALWLLRALLRKARFYYFGYYCIIIAVVTLLFMR